MLFRLLLVMTGLLALGGCSLSTIKSGSAVDETDPLADIRSALADQQKELGDQSQKIDAIRDNQASAEQAIVKLEKAIAELTQVINTMPESKPLLVQAQPVLTDAGTTQETSDERGDKFTIGRLEWLWLDSAKTYLKARIDTGARTSSLHAEDIQPFERDGKNWIRFVTRSKGVPFSMEAPLVKYAKVKQASSESSDRRPVVVLSVGLGELQEETEFTLANRSKMLYPVLIGRNFIRDMAIVDVSQKFIYKRDPKHLPEDVE